MHLLSRLESAAFFRILLRLPGRHQTRQIAVIHCVRALPLSTAMSPDFIRVS
jgi:hypothetical protein